jgi:outer membrane protein OmpA-like peptidoglycan-associated protein
MRLHNLSPIVLAASVLAFSVTLPLASEDVQAQSRPQFSEGIYVGAGAGAHKPQSADVSRAGGNGGGVDLKAGFAGAAALGYAFGNGLRAEVELAHRMSKAKSGAFGQPASGKLDATSVMVNGLYDIATGTDFVPYVGVGVGAARLRAENFGALPGSVTVGGNGTVFAYQGIAGLDYLIDNNVAIGASYRYFATQKAEIATSAGDKAKLPYRDHALLVGMRWSFGTPAAPAQPVQAQTPATPAAIPPAAPSLPAPAAATAGPRQFTVFFDFDKADISGDANRVLVQAADSAKSGSFTRITATGHTDTMGAPRYNMALSIRRANAVRDVLVREGIPASAIVVIGRGETQLMVPTPDQTKEPRNRRVEIVIE